MQRTLLTACVLLVIVHVGMSLAACGKGKNPTISELQGKWVLKSIDGKAVESKPILYFKIDGNTISGFDGCNNFGGPLDKPYELRMSQRACPPDSPRLPLQLSDPWAQLKTSKLQGDTLDVTLDDDAGVARFHREE